MQSKVVDKVRTFDSWIINSQLIKSNAFHAHDFDPKQCLGHGCNMLFLGHLF
jgi:hypothetical protein